MATIITDPQPGVAQARPARPEQARARAARTWALWRRLLPVSLGLAGVYAALVCRWLLQPGAPAMLALLAGCSSALLLVCAGALGRRRIAIGATHRYAAWLAAVVWLNSLAQLALLRDPRDTLGLVLLLLGTGLLFTSARWLVLTTAATLGGWLLLAWPLGLAWPQAGQTLLGAALLAALLYARRMRTLEQTERLPVRYVGPHGLRSQR